MNAYLNTARNMLTVNDRIDLQHILAVLIGQSSTPEICGRLATKSARQIMNMSLEDLQREGLTRVASLRILAAVELTKRVLEEKTPEKYKIRTPNDAAKYVMDNMRFYTQEHLVCLYLNTKNEVIHWKTIFIGSLNASIIHPREVFKEALKHSAASLICFHNHPSGDPSPSHEDIEVTKRLVECGFLIGIEVLDHIIIGDQKFVSLKEKGFVQNTFI